LSNPNYIFAVVTHELAIPYVPQGPFYDLLSKFGAGRELQRLEQQSAAIPCGGYSVVSYVLTAPGGPRTPPNPAPPSYEIASNEGHSALLLMSLMESAGGGGPYSLMDSYTWTSPP
jgi:hypothetical protein